jgi:hypothetical protein
MKRVSGKLISMLDTVRSLRLSPIRPSYMRAMLVSALFSKRASQRLGARINSTMSIAFLVKYAI